MNNTLKNKRVHRPSRIVGQISVPQSPNTTKLCFTDKLFASQERVLSRSGLPSPIRNKDLNRTQKGDSYCDSIIRLSIKDYLPRLTSSIDSTAQNSRQTTNSNKVSKPRAKRIVFTSRDENANRQVHRV